jgi:type IV pilus assembly protein PilX
MKRRLRHPRSGTQPPSHQEGLILFVALIVLVALTLSGLSLMRSSGTGLLIAGNLSFRQASVSVADNGTEAARSWLLSTALNTLDNNDSTNGYYATQNNLAGSAAEFDHANHDWGSNSKTVNPAPDAATTVRWVVHRLCTATGSPVASGQSCVFLETGSNAGSNKNVLSSSQRALGSQSVLYRVTTRVDGPRNSIAYTQVVIY